MTVKYKKGFSIGEVVISSFILVIGIVAALNLVSQSLAESMDSRNAIIAAELAQEGVELVRNIRDNNMANRASGAATFDKLPSNSDTGCTIDKDSTCIGPGGGCDNCNPGSGNKQLHYTGSFYKHSGGPVTRFSRKIDLTYQDTTPPIDGATRDELWVTSTVIWGSSFPAAANCNIANKCVSVQAVLTDR